MVRTLLWVTGNVTPAQKLAASRVGAAIRDRRAWHHRDAVEECESVAGDPPPPYQHLPRVNIPTLGNVAPLSVSPQAPVSPPKRSRQRKQPVVNTDAESLL